MFRDAHQPNDVKDIDTNPHKDFIKECEEKISEYNTQIAEIKKEIKLAEKKFKGKSNGD